MPRKIRSDSLYAQLTPEQRDLLFEVLMDKGMSYDFAVKLCVKEFKIRPSRTALCEFLRQHGFTWRMDQAKALANDKATSLPKDFDAKKKTALAQREFEKAFHNLSTSEVIALQRLELDRQIAKTQGEIELEKLKIARIKLQQKEEDQALARQKFQRECCENFLDWYNDKRARDIAESGTSRAEQIERLGQAMFEDWGEEEAK